MALHNPNNWHWVNKDVSEWTREWFKNTLVNKLEATDGDVTAKISGVQSMDGDVDVSQRKGKVITIFDVKLVLEYSGSAPDAADVSGNITIPEIAHDTAEDEYVFDIDVFSESKEKQPVKDLVKAKLVPALRKTFQTLGPALISTHGADIQHAANHQTSFSAAKTHPERSGSSTPAQTSSQTNKSGGVVNTTTVSDTQEFRCPAEEAYKVFVDPARIAAFTRSPPKVFEGAKKGGKFELFGGNVSGEYLELEENKKIVQSWRLGQWPAGHYSTLKIEFDQNDVDHVTVMRVTWDGVPIGQEDVTKRNWLEYYVKSIKQAFGFGTIL